MLNLFDVLSTLLSSFLVIFSFIASYFAKICFAYSRIDLMDFASSLFLRSCLMCTKASQPKMRRWSYKGDLSDQISSGIPPLSELCGDRLMICIAICKASLQNAVRRLAVDSLHRTHRLTYSHSWGFPFECKQIRIRMHGQVFIFFDKNVFSEQRIGNGP